MNQGSLPEIPLALGGFLRKYMIFKRLASLDFSGAGSLEPFGRRSICLHFRHSNSFKTLNISKSKFIGNKKLHRFLNQSLKDRLFCLFHEKYL